MKKVFLLLLVVLITNILAQDWYDQRGKLTDEFPVIQSKDSTWESYSNNPSWVMPIPDERAVYFNVNDFGLEYPVNLQAIASFLYSDGDEYGFAVYDKDGSTVLYQKSRLTSIVDYNYHYLSSPIVLNDDFYVAVRANSEGLPTQVTSDVLETTNSYTGTAGDWTLFTQESENYEHILRVQLSPFEGTDVYPPSIRNITGTECYQDINAVIRLTIQDQSTIISPVIGEYSFDNGSTWTSFDLMSDKGENNFYGQIPGQPDGVSAILRFNVEDDLGNSVASNEYQVNWSKDNPLLLTSFETDPFSEGWSLNSVGAGWNHQYTSQVYTKPHTGSYQMNHLDDTGTQDDWLISPLFTLPDESNILLSYWEASRYVDYIGFHEVAVTADGGVSWTQVSSTVPSENLYEQVFCSLDAFSGQDIQIGWHYEGDYCDQWFIDDVEVFVNTELPTINKLYANLTVLPIVGTFINEDMTVSLGLYDRSYIQTAVMHYTFDGGATYNDVNMVRVKGEELWQGDIPAKDSIATGSIYFDVTNLTGSTLTTGNYTVKFVVDEWNPVIEKVVGNIVQVNKPANINLTISDHSGITSCTGYFSKDGFATQTEIPFTNSKVQYINLFNMIGTIPAESELAAGEIKFVIVDNGGNTVNSAVYPVQWISSMPKSFDLRTSLGTNYVTSVKEQVTGTCWCMAACSATEGSLLKSGMWEAAGETGEPNLSENHLDWWNGFNDFYNQDIYPEDGEGLELHNRGDYLVTSAYLSRGEGFVREIDAPDGFQPARFSDTYHYFYPKDIEWHSMDENLNGIDVIKKTIMENGVIGTSFCYSYDFMYTADHFHYQDPEQPWYITHAVSIVGWDDDKTSSYNIPPGPGAWLCKNSWGSEWGEDGYFWASYYDKYIGRDPEGAMSFQNVEPMKYDKIYYHDYHGWSDTMSDVDEAFNAFTSEKEEDIVAVSFFVAKDNVDYTVTIYDEFDGFELASPLVTTSGHIDYKGFHTIDLPSVTTIPNADDFYVYLYLSNGGQPYDQSSVTPTSNWLPYRSTASAGESFYKSEGAWLDLYDNMAIDKPQTANFCIKALCDDESSIDDGEWKIENYELEQNYPNPFNPTTTINFLVPND
ncbi:MAG: choice-of-anchor J domain-containing protein, partial [Candidatus Delongbacteria bacterium]|nr:choice-of-anchor J domain-containing protein [Candidatus Delongbacteria bacterium]